MDFVAFTDTLVWNRWWIRFNDIRVYLLVLSFAYWIWCQSTFIWPGEIHYDSRLSYV